MNTSINDSLMDGVAFDDLITMVHSNEPVIDKEAVIRCFEELAHDALRHGRRTLNQKLDYIIESVKEGRE